PGPGRPGPGCPGGTGPAARLYTAGSSPTRPGLGDGRRAPPAGPGPGPPSARRPVPSPRRRPPPHPTATADACAQALTPWPTQARPARARRGSGRVLHDQVADPGERVLHVLGRAAADGLVG